MANIRDPQRSALRMVPVTVQAVAGSTLYASIVIILARFDFENKCGIVSPF